MSTNWKERWEENDVDGATVVDVATWSDGSAAVYRYREPSGYEGSTSFVDQLIPRKPAPVVVAWEPDEVPVGAVVRWISNSEATDVIVRRFSDKFKINESWYTCDELKDHFVLHKPKVDTKDCQPCGKVVGK